MVSGIRLRTGFGPVILNELLSSPNQFSHHKMETIIVTNKIFCKA